MPRDTIFMLRGHLRPYCPLIRLALGTHRAHVAAPGVLSVCNWYRCIVSDRSVSGRVPMRVAGCVAVQGRRWRRRVLHAAEIALPSGIGIAVGMYVSPKWTIPRVIGSMAEQAWFRAHRC